MKGFNFDIESIGDTRKKSGYDRVSPSQHGNQISSFHTHRGEHVTPPKYNREYTQSRQYLILAVRRDNCHMTLAKDGAY